jgi:hypothetical protein
MTSVHEIKLQAELAMRRLQAEPSTSATAIAQAFEPLFAALNNAMKRQPLSYETKG